MRSYFVYFCYNILFLLYHYLTQITKEPNLIESQRAKAEKICREAGHTGFILEDCILDVGITGEEAFAEISLDLPEPEVTVDILEPELSDSTDSAEYYGTLEICVFDDVTKYKIMDAYVNSTMGISTTTDMYLTDDGNCYGFSGITPGDNYSVKIAKSGYVSKYKKVTIDTGEITKIEVELTPE